MFLKFLPTILLSPEGETAGGGSVAPPPATKPDAQIDPKAFADLMKANADLMERLSKLEGTKPQATPVEDDLLRKARETRDTEDKRKNDTKALEAAISFNMNSENFLKQNSALLPKEISDIFKQANSENYGSAIEKTAAIKSGILQSFFAVQSNVDLLTPGLKSQLDDYLKLTKTGKQEKALQMFDMIFEPAFEMLKRVKTAEALGRGYSTGASADEAYKQKMMGLSKKHYLGEK